MAIAPGSSFAGAAASSEGLVTPGPWGFASHLRWRFSARSGPAAGGIERNAGFRKVWPGTVGIGTLGIAPATTRREGSRTTGEQRLLLVGAPSHQHQTKLLLVSGAAHRRVKPALAAVVGRAPGPGAQARGGCGRSRMEPLTGSAWTGVSPGRESSKPTSRSGGEMRCHWIQAPRRGNRWRKNAASSSRPALSFGRKGFADPGQG